MTTFPGSSHLIKGGLVLLARTTAQVQHIIVLQYNPNSLSHTFQVQAVSEAAIIRKPSGSGTWMQRARQPV